jgi:hypothetical protein
MSATGSEANSRHLLYERLLTSSANRGGNDRDGRFPERQELAGSGMSAFALMQG